jgi:FO synthase
MGSSWTDAALLETSLADLMTAARAVRDAQFGTRVTYSPKVFIPLTQLCNDTCGYCTFAQPPARVASLYMPIEEVLRVAAAGA